MPSPSGAWLQRAVAVAILGRCSRRMAPLPLANQADKGLQIPSVRPVSTGGAIPPARRVPGVHTAAGARFHYWLHGRIAGWRVGLLMGQFRAYFAEGREVAGAQYDDA